MWPKNDATSFWLQNLAARLAGWLAGWLAGCIHPSIHPSIDRSTGGHAIDPGILAVVRPNNAVTIHWRRQMTIGLEYGLRVAPYLAHWHLNQVWNCIINLRISRPPLCFGDDISGMPSLE